MFANEECSMDFRLFENSLLDIVVTGGTTGAWRFKRAVKNAALFAFGWSFWHTSLT
jgi:hypothetical protein